MRRRVKAVVLRGEAALSVVDLLVRRYPFKDREQWQAVALSQRVMVNGVPALPAQLLNPGDELFYEAPESAEPAVDLNLGVLFEDEALLVLNKPGNLPCHPSGCYYENTLWYQISAQLGVTAPHLINRLDRETSGVVLVAKTEAAARNLSQQFFHRRVSKVYTVIVEGAFPERVEAAGWLMPDLESAVRKKRCFVAGTPESKPGGSAEWAESRFELMRRADEISLVRVQLQTGRLHQIRATLCSLGFPVVGDKLYGVDDTLFLRFISGQMTMDDLQKLRMARQALHAGELSVTHPDTGQPLLFTAPLPPDMSAVLGPGRVRIGVKPNNRK